MNEQKINRAYKIATFSAIVGTVIEVLNAWLPTITNTIDGNVQWDFYFTLRYIVANLPSTFLTLFVGSFLFLLVSLIYKNLGSK